MTISLSNITKCRYVPAKLGGMRKPQTFFPHRTSNGTVVVQSDKSIGTIDLVTGAGKLNTKGCYFVHLAAAQPFQFPPEFVEAVKQAIGVFDSLSTVEGGF